MIKSYYQDQLITEYHGHIMEVLKELPPESVHCIVTSPPYWGLRDYGLEPQIWDGEPNCEHEWGEWQEKHDTREETTAGKSRTTERFYGEKSRRFDGNHQKHTSGQFCQKCSAWRGSLGLEPTPELYIQHIVQIWRELKRVLRKDGVCWLNIGDSYTGSGGNQGHTPESKHLNRHDTLFSDAPPPQAKVIGLKPKDLCMIPARVALALQADGWWLRSDIIWSKCLSGGTIIYAKTQKGEMPMTIREMSRLKPDTIQLWSGDEWIKVKKIEEVYPDKAIELELRNGQRIGCTPEHRWPTDNGLLRANQLKKGDIIESRILPRPETPLQPEGMPDWIGFAVGVYLAEGSKTEGKLQFSLHAKKDILITDMLEKFAHYYGGSIHVHDYGLSRQVIIESKICASIIDTYIGGNGAKRKHLKVIAWQRDNQFLYDVLLGYLKGDGHRIKEGFWKLGFTGNEALVRDLRILAARLRFSVRLKWDKALETKTQKWHKIFRGSLRELADRKTSDGEIIAIRRSRGRRFYHIEVEEPHIFTLASGIQTHNSNPMPESVTDRPTRSHEYVFLLTKSGKYFYDADAVREKANYPNQGKWSQGDNKGYQNNQAYKARKLHDFVTDSGRNLRSVWTIATEPNNDVVKTDHFCRVEADAVSCGMAHTMSPYCPVHGDLFDRVATDFCGGYVADWLNRIKHMRNYLFPCRPNDSAPIDLSLLRVSAQQNLDLLYRECFPFAIDHNTESHKKALSLLTNPSYSAFVEILSHTDDKQELLWFFALQTSIHGNSILPDEMDAHLLDQIPSRIVDKSSLPIPPNCLCSYYHKITKKTSHFAAFPAKLVEKCILAGTSEKGCCPECGSPWVRVVEKNRTFESGSGKSGNPIQGKQEPVQGAGYVDIRLGPTIESKTIGWKPSCGCIGSGYHTDTGARLKDFPYTPIPCTVLDPFSGSGKTLIVAKKFGCKAIGIDLKQEYLDMPLRKVAQERMF